VTDFSGGLLSFELSVEFTWLNSSISTIMQPVDGRMVSQWLDPRKRHEPS
jgi:hypothetical protein